MAQRRMITKHITHQSRFLSMPLETQALYFHLSLEADDDGYCEPLFVVRMINANEQSISLLDKNGFIEILGEVVHITNWEKANKIQPSRYNESQYKTMYPVVTLTNVQQNVDKVPTQVRLGKVRLGKVNEEEVDTSLTHKKFSSKKDIDNNLLKDISETLDVPHDFVVDCWDTAQNWLLSNGQVKKDYKAFLINWVKRDKAKMLLEVKKFQGGNHGTRITKI